MSREIADAQAERFCDMVNENLRLKKFAYIQERRYEVIEDANGWFDLTSDGELVAKLVSFEEARRVIWMYWTNLNVDMAYLEADDFDDIV